MAGHKGAVSRCSVCVQKRGPPHSLAFKAKVALEAVRGEETGARYEVHPGQIQAWKKAIVEGASGVFGNGVQRQLRIASLKSLPTLIGCLN